MKALVLDGGSKGLAFFKNLTDNGVKTFIMYRKGGLYYALGYLGGNRMPTFKEEWDSGWEPEYPHPIKNEKEFHRRILNVIDKYNIGIIFPVHSVELTSLYKIKANIESLGCIFPSGDTSAYHKLRNKTGIYFDGTIRQYLPEAYIGLTGEWYVKPESKTSGDGVSKVGFKDDFWILQESFDGYGAGFEAFCVNGKVISYFMHRRKREFPIKGGSSTSRVSYYHPGIEKASKEIIKNVNWTGFIMLEYKVNSDCKFKLIEINPRPWGSIQLAIDAGIEFPIIAYNYYCHGIEVPPEGYSRIETRLVPYDIMAGVCHLFRGDFKQFWDSISLWKNFHWEAFRPFDWRYLFVNFHFIRSHIKLILLPLVNKLRGKK